MRFWRNLGQAWRGVRTNRGNVVLMMLGIIIGISSLTVIIGIGEGAKAKVLDRLTSMGFGADSFTARAGAGKLFFARAPEPTSLSLADADDIRALPAVKMVVPMQRKSLKVIYQRNFAETQVFGVTPQWIESGDWAMQDGAFFNDLDMEKKRKAVVLGTTPARKLFGGEDPVGKTIRLDKVFFDVIGVLAERGVTESGYDPDDRAVIPLTTSTARLLRQTHLHSIRVMTLGPELVENTMTEVQRILRRNHGLSPLAEDDFRFITPMGIMEFVTQEEQALNRMLALISTLSLLVGGIVIMNIMLVSIQERVREIGIRRCFGARRLDITLQFMGESVFVTLLGGVMGVVLGLAISFGLKYFKVVATVISAQPFAIAFVLCVLIGLVFGIQPARKAALLNPDEAIR